MIAALERADQFGVDNGVDGFGGIAVQTRVAGFSVNCIGVHVLFIIWAYEGLDLFLGQGGVEPFLFVFFVKQQWHAPAGVVDFLHQRICDRRNNTERLDCFSTLVVGPVVVDTAERKNFLRLTFDEVGIFDFIDFSPFVKSINAKDATLVWNAVSERGFFKNSLSYGV